MKEEEKAGLRKSNIVGVDLITVHYIHVVTIIIKPFYANNLC
jgi:hypothetical protein